MKKFCLVIAVILVFVCSCDNLYNDVAEEKKDMQKLIFVNADGVTVDLTKDPYGITEWEGFSKVDLNLQTQQVPFHDGSVYLDGLLSERELSVTLAMNDEKNLEKRYRLRRELIEILNPKLGEGTLIYTNNYTSKQIKVIPKTPLFENHNSNDSGTPKASLAWTACDPYWEDIEETSVWGENDEIIKAENNGDVSTNIKIKILGDISSATIVDTEDSKKISVTDVTPATNLYIDTNFGKKNVNKLSFTDNTLCNYSNIQDMCYMENTLLYVAIVDNQVKGSYDFVNWKLLYKEDGCRFTAIYYSKKFEKLIISKNNGDILITSDAYNFESSFSASRLINSFCENNDYLIGVGNNGVVIKTEDLINWTETITNSSNTQYKILYVDYYDCFYVVGFNGSAGIIMRSTDNGETWTTTTHGLYDIYGIAYQPTSHRLVIVGSNGRTDYSNNGGDNWWQLSVITGDSIVNVKYCGGTVNCFVAFTNSFRIMISSNGMSWTSITTPDEFGTVIAPYSFFISGGICSNLSQRKFYLARNNGGILEIEKMPTSNKDFNVIRQTKVANMQSIAYNPKDDVIISIGAYTYLSVAHLITVKISKGQIKFSEVAVGVTTFGQNRIKIKYISEKNIFIILVGNFILISNNNGETWQSYQTGFLSYISDIVFYEKRNCYLLCGYSAVTGGGFSSIREIDDNFTNENGLLQFTSVTDLSINYVKEKELFVVCGSTGALYNVIDNGNLDNWLDETQITTPMSSNCKNSLFYKKKNLMLVCAQSDVYYSYDFENYHRLFLTSDLGTLVLQDINFDESNKTVVVTGYIQNSLTNAFMYGVVLTSYDGINFRQTLITPVQLTRGGYCNNLGFVCCGYFVTLLNYIDKIGDSVINKITSDSDMNLNLKKGINYFKFNSNDSSSIVVITYRQKYLGV